MKRMLAGSITAVAALGVLPGPVHATWTMKRNGTGLRKVTRGPHPDFRPDWGSRPG
jgi:hypothetical protein